MCGDAANPEQVSALLSGAKYDLLLTDPPYNANLKMLNDNFECLQDYLDWYDSWFQIALQHAKESASFYLWGYDKTYCEIKVMLNKYEQLKLSNIIIWDKVCFGRTLPKFKSNKETFNIKLNMN